MTTNVPSVQPSGYYCNHGDEGHLTLTTQSFSPKPYYFCSCNFSQFWVAPTNYILKDTAAAPQQTRFQCGRCTKRERRSSSATHTHTCTCRSHIQCVPGRDTSSVFRALTPLSPSGLTTKSCYSHKNPSTDLFFPTYRNWSHHKPPPTPSDLPAACSSGPPAALSSAPGIEPSALLHHARGTAFLTIWGQHRPSSLLKNLSIQRSFFILTLIIIINIIFFMLCVLCYW